ncbi:MAG: FAD-binding protein [Ignavibacteriaceae bacterium]|nr:FAD-binding protein [Ignavibacteriaceae bacterium]
MLLYKNSSLRNYNSLHLESAAESLGIFTNISEMQELRRLLTEFRGKIRIIGSGSTILLQGNLSGLTLVNKFRGADVIEEEDDKAIVGVNSGEKLDTFLKWCAEKKLYGLESLSGVWGSVGGALVRNESSFGRAIGDRVSGVKVFELETSSEKNLSREECEFDYHSSIFRAKAKNRFFISRIKFVLDKVHSPNLNYREIKQIMRSRGISDLDAESYREVVLEYRKSRFPGKGFYHAGQFFENPLIPVSKVESLLELYPDISFNKIDENSVRVPVRWLIEKTGWKNMNIGQAFAWQKNPAILTHRGNAKPQDFLVLVHLIKKEVMEKFGIELNELVTFL